MYCTKCGKEIRADAKFCPSCGEPQNNIGSDRKGTSHLINVGVYIDNIRLNISSVDKVIMDEIDQLLTAQFSNNEFISHKKYGFIQSTGYYHIDWFMPLAVKDLFGWEEFLCDAFKAVSTHLSNNGFRYFPEKRMFEKEAAGKDQNLLAY
jgi:hypothetical protein